MKGNHNLRKKQKENPREGNPTDNTEQNVLTRPQAEGKGETDPEQGVKKEKRKQRKE